MTTLVYETNVESRAALHHRIFAAAEHIRIHPDNVASATQSLLMRAFFLPSFNTLHKVILLTRVASVTLFCTFERGIVIPTSDSDFMNFYTLQTISRSPLLCTRFFLPCSDIFKL